VVGAAKVTARNFPANVAPDDPETRQAREAAAEVIRMLAQASDKVSRQAGAASDKLKKAAADTVMSVKVASSQASATIFGAINMANDRLLDVTRTAVIATVGKNDAGAYEAEFIELESLRNKLRKRRGERRVPTRSGRPRSRYIRKT